MNKKGFTLPELLVILVFVVIIYLIAFPNITGMLKKTRENEYKSFLNDIYLATEAYIQKYNIEFPSLLEENGQAQVYIEDLVYAKLLKSTTYDPKNKVNLKEELDFTVVITKGEETYQYELIEEKLDKVDYRPAKPELKEGLIPVNIANDGTVTKADYSNSSFSWYNYNKKKWANAVILVDETISYNVGDIIPENNIESYFVWIPRYRYKLWDLGNYTSLTSTDAEKIHQISIIFEDKDQSKSDGTCNGTYETETVGCYYTHPAFTFGDTELNGIWVGKFETSKSSVVSSNESDKVTIKPNVKSWRNVNIATAFDITYNYKRNYDSHMMKNTEWGAVAYLSHSRYGIQDSVRNNNNSSYMTGYAAVKEPTCGYTNDNAECSKYGTSSDLTQPYNTETGILASTTGNITGIYDMSGGAREHLMGVAADSDGIPLAGRNVTYNSGFSGNLGCPTCDGADGSITSIEGADLPERKYYDLYPNNNSYLNYKNRILGDASGELGPFGTKNVSSWYNDITYIVGNSYQWVNRGGTYYDGINSGIFNLSYSEGIAAWHFSFRIVLAF